MPPTCGLKQMTEQLSEVENGTTQMFTETGNSGAVFTFLQHGCI